MVLPHVGFSPLRLTEGAFSAGGIPQIDIRLSLLPACPNPTQVGPSYLRKSLKDNFPTHPAFPLPPEVLAPTGLCSSDLQRLSTSPTSSKPITRNQAILRKEKPFPGFRGIPHFRHCFFRACRPLRQEEPVNCLHSAFTHHIVFVKFHPHSTFF